MPPHRLVCVVEGHGEVLAMTTLCARVLHGHLGVPPERWFVDKDPIRHPRSGLVDERVLSPSRPPREDGLSRVVQLARARPADAALVVVDGDKDCPAAWGPPATALIQAQVPGFAVMAVREYEAWLLAGHAEASLEDVADDADAVRNAKARAGRVWRGYRPTTHQLEKTRTLDVALAIRRSRSFGHLVRAVAGLTGDAAEAER